MGKQKQTIFKKRWFDITTAYWARICRSFKETRYRFSAWRAGTKPYLSYWPARLHRRAKSIPRYRFLGSINVYIYGLWATLRHCTAPSPYRNALTWMPESVATLPPFSPIEGQKWFDQISRQWESQKNRFALIYFGKIQFLPPFEISRSCPPPRNSDRGSKRNHQCTLIIWSLRFSLHSPIPSWMSETETIPILFFLLLQFV